MFFKDYLETGLVYHVAPLANLGDILDKGLRMGESCSGMYKEFNSYFDRFKPESIPDWVSRERAIYGSMNFRNNHSWHSHSVILAFRIDVTRCWVGNENLANMLYEPFILKDVSMFRNACKLICSRGEEFVINYWSNSMNFKSNLETRLDLKEGFDAEIMIMHDVSPRDISVLKLVSDHRIMDAEQWDSTFSHFCCNPESHLKD